MILYHSYTIALDDRDFAKVLKNKNGPLAQLAEQLIKSQLHLFNLLFFLALKSHFLKIP
tara:strand:+ start:975 stop:1151 length:177 start_codon:yes stop_codon:yes gene_type:complete